MGTQGRESQHAPRVCLQNGRRPAGLVVILVVSEDPGTQGGREVSPQITPGCRQKEPSRNVAGQAQPILARWLLDQKTWPSPPKWATLNPVRSKDAEQEKCRRSSRSLPVFKSVQCRVHCQESCAMTDCALELSSSSDGTEGWPS